MARFSEETFKHWKRAASESEEQRISNAIRIIKDAISKSEELNDLDIEVFVQGSYANNTNVRAESDVDICIMLGDTFYSEYPKGLTRDDYGFTPGSNKFETYRENIYRALINHFGYENLKPGNKSIKIRSNSYRVDADAVPCFQYRNYKYPKSKDPKNYVEGVKFFSRAGETVVNYPKIHVQNGKRKNKATSKRYKRLTRILKRARYKMVEDGIPVNDNISSFLIECLVWNVPNEILNSYDNWSDRVKESIRFLYKKTKDKEKCEKWGEVSEKFYLFRDYRKWNRGITNTFLVQLWNFFEFRS